MDKDQSWGWGAAAPGPPDPEPNAEPVVRPRDGATVIRLHAGQLAPEVFLPVMMGPGRMDRIEARRVCMQGPGFLARNVDPQVAQELSAALEAQGEPCFVVPAAQVVALPAAALVCSARLGKSGVELADAKGQAEALPWPAARVLAMAHLHFETTETVTVPGRTTYYGSGAVVVTPSRHKEVHRESHHAFVDLVFQDPLRRYRIDAHRFDYSLLGDQLQPSNDANIRSVARWLLYAAPHLHTNLDAAGLKATGHAELPFLSTHQFEDLTQWLVNLVHFGKVEPRG